MKDRGSDWLPGESHGDSVQCPVGARHPRGEAKANPRKMPPPMLRKQLYSHGPKLEIIRMSPTG